MWISEAAQAQQSMSWPEGLVWIALIVACAAVVIAAILRGE